MAGGMSWTLDDSMPAVINDDTGATQHLADFDVIWWRRLTGAAQIPESVSDPAARDLVVNDTRDTLTGMVLTVFSGAWISHPEATRAAQNKLVQLRTARAAGLRVPRTLVSQDPAAVRRFCEELGYNVVAKSVKGTHQTPIMTGRVTPEVVAKDDAVRLSPAIYQELIGGSAHLRVCCFGDTVCTGLLRSELLDWRYPLEGTDVSVYELDAVTRARVGNVIRSLGLRMGVVDMKLMPDGEPCWFEVNPQGQFLFLEGMCSELPLTRVFADFLEEEVRRARERAAAADHVAAGAVGAGTDAGN